MIRVPLVSRPYLLDLLIGSLSPVAHLLACDIPLDWCATLEEMREPVGGGYAPQATTGWTPAELVTPVGRTTADPLVWMHAGPTRAETVYGYYMTDGVSGPLIWCELSSLGPLPWGSLGDVIAFLPRFDLGPLGIGVNEPELPLCGFAASVEEGEGGAS